MVDFCDSHIHVVGDPARHPLVAGRTFTPGVATIEQVQRLGGPMGVTRFVIVQPSFYGTDNGLMLETLDAMGKDMGRGVAVIDPNATTPAILADLAASGVRGLRLNLYSKIKGRNALSLAESFAATAGHARAMGWHMQVIAPIAGLIAAADVLASSPVPVVIDHYGLPEGVSPDSEMGQHLLALLACPHVWIKLSAPYRSTGNQLGTVPDAGWLAAILAVAADRCVWGSDWPHTPDHGVPDNADTVLPYRVIDYAALVENFCRMLPSPAMAMKIMRDNPARLYGFPAG